MEVTTSDTAEDSNVQHSKPCHDCPWRRKAVPGWLGSMSADEWIQAAHGDGVIDCHTVKGVPQPQCVGAATYRANVCKSPRDRRALRAERGSRCGVQVACRVQGTPRDKGD
jgi:hypothetical protein